MKQITAITGSCIALALMSAGCATTITLRPTDLDRIHMGDTMQTVRDRLGEPIKVLSQQALGYQSHQTVWVYDVYASDGALPVPLGLRQMGLREELTGVRHGAEPSLPPLPEVRHVAVTFVDDKVAMVTPEP